MNDISDNLQAMQEKVWATLDRIAERQAETDRRQAERQAETDRLSRETDRKIGETTLNIDRLYRSIDSMNERIEGISKSNGSFAEDYFFNSFERGEKNFFGEKFDFIRKNLPSVMVGFNDDYDIALFNGKTVVIIEVKYKAQSSDTGKTIKKAKTFKINYPYYQNHRIYLGLAAMAFDKKVEQKCIEKGIAVIKQKGDTVVIADEHLKVF